VEYSGAVAIVNDVPGFRSVFYKYGTVLVKKRDLMIVSFSQGRAWLAHVVSLLPKYTKLIRFTSRRI